MRITLRHGASRTALLLAAGLAVNAGAQAQTAAPQAVTPLPPVSVETSRLQDIGTTEAIDQKDIDARNPTSLRQLFQGETAITGPGASTGAQKFYLHGIDQSKLNVRIDGTPQRNNVWHHNGNMTLDPTFLKSVQIESGVSAADSGPGAAAGSVRFTTKNAADLLLPGRSFGGRTIVSYDTDTSTRRVTGAGYGKSRGYDLLAIATYSTGGNYRGGNGVEEPGTGTDLVSGLAKLGFEATQGHLLRLSGEYAEDKAPRRLRPNMGLVGNTTGNLFNSNRATRQTFTFTYENRETSSIFDPKFEVYHNTNALHRPNDNNRTTAHGAFNSRIVSKGGKLQNTFQIPGGTLTAGGDMNLDDVAVERFHFASNAGEKIDNYGIYVQARVAPIDRLRISTGIRNDSQSYRSVDQRSFDNSGVSPNASAEFDIARGLTALGGYSRNFVGLEMFEAGLFHAANYTYSADLKPTIADNAKIGLRYVTGGLSLEGGLFDTQVRNPLASNDTTRVRINGQTLHSKGYDLSAAYGWRNAFVSAKYTHTDVRYGGRTALPSDYNTAISVGDLFAMKGEYVWESIALTTGATLDHARKFSDPLLAANGFSNIPAYTVFGVYGEWAPADILPNWSLRLDANNLFDQTYFSRGTYFRQGTTVTPVNSPGRSFLISSTYKF
jgi:hemoglobin/transferrin/lactoferrin receptor protein